MSEKQPITDNPIPPEEAASLFYAGEILAFVDDPSTPIVCGKWMGEYCLCSQLPFDDNAGATAYFTENPVMQWTGEGGDAPPPEIPPEPPGKAQMAFLFQLNFAVVEATGMTLTTKKAVDVEVGFRTVDGAPADKPGAITWATSDASIVIAQPSSNDAVASIDGVSPGTAVITASCADLSATLEVGVTA